MYTFTGKLRSDIPAYFVHCLQSPYLNTRIITLVRQSLEIWQTYTQFDILARGGVEDIRLQAKAKDTKKLRGQGQPFRGQTLSRPRPRTKDTGASVLKKKKVFSSDLQKRKVLNNFLLVLVLRSRGFYVQAYADDLAVLVTGADMLWIRGMAQKAVNTAANWALEQELQFSSKKTEIVLFTHKWNPDLGSLSMTDSKLELSKEARLLRVTLDSKVTWKPHFTRITRKATTALLH